LLLIVTFSSSHAFNDDAFYYKNLEQKGIKRITERKFDKWEVISIFNEEGYLVREINFYKKEIRSDYKYEYAIMDTLIEMKRTNSINNDVKNLKIDKYYYTSSGQCHKHSMYFSDSDASSHNKDNFVYEDGKLISYTQGEMGQTKFEYTYNEKGQKEHIQKFTRYGYITFFSFAYNKFGQLTDYIQEGFIQEGYNNDDEINEIIVYSGVVVWSKEKTNKIHIRYSNFDKRGNWTRSHFITEKGKVFRSERKIEYW